MHKCVRDVKAAFRKVSPNFLNIDIVTTQLFNLKNKSKDI